MTGLRSFIITIKKKWDQKKHTITLKEFQKNMPGWIIEYSKQPSGGLPCTVNKEALKDQLEQFQDFIETKKLTNPYYGRRRPLEILVNPINGKTGDGKHNQFQVYGMI